MPARIALAAALLIGLAGLSGCGPARLDETTKFTIDAVSGRVLDLAAQPQAQKITVEFDSTAGEVKVGLFKTGTQVDADNLDLTKAIQGTRAVSGAFTADVPGNTDTQVIVGGASKRTEVKLHVTNRK